MEKSLLYFSVFLNLVLLYVYKSNLKVLGKYFFQKSKEFLKNKLVLVGFYHNQSCPIDDASFVYRAEGTQIYFLRKNKFSLHTKQLPNCLIIQPGLYIFNNEHYDFLSEGLYRCMFPDKNLNQQRIVYQNNMTTLMSSLAWMISHGHRDDGLTYNELYSKATCDKLILTCESIARFSFTLLTQLNIKSRIVGVRTLSPSNGYDDGHYLIEVYRPDLSQWVLYDLDSNVFFTYQNQPLSLIDFLKYVEESNYEINYISSNIRAAVDDIGIKSYNFAFINEARFANLKNWYKRVMQFAFINYKNENFSYFIKPKLENYPKGAFPKINFLTREEFIHSFYQ